MTIVSDLEGSFDSINPKANLRYRTPGVTVDVREAFLQGAKENNFEDTW